MFIFKLNAKFLSLWIEIAVLFVLLKRFLISITNSLISVGFSGGVPNSKSHGNLNSWPYITLAGVWWVLSWIILHLCYSRHICDLPLCRVSCTLPVGMNFYRIEFGNLLLNNLQLRIQFSATDQVGTIWWETKLEGTPPFLKSFQKYHIFCGLLKALFISFKP